MHNPISTLGTMILAASLPIPASAQRSLPSGWVTSIQTFPGMKMGESRTADLMCPAGTSVSGGGYETDGSDRSIAVTASAPHPREGWSVAIKNFGPVQRNVTIAIFAGCK